MIHVKMLDHLVMTVRDIEATCDFYSRILGMEVVTFGDARKALIIGDLKINLHQFGREFKPHAKYPSLGSEDLCFLTDRSMEQIVSHLLENRVRIVEGPVERTGASGPILSVYVSDPEGNLIEIATRLITSIPDRNDAA